MKAIEIAKKLGLSTSALRHYESWGIIPPVKRAENGYRIYTKKHEAYFYCIQALNAGFGMDVVKEVMPLLIKGESTEAMWRILREQSRLQEKKHELHQTIAMLEAKDQLEDRQNMTIGDIAKEAQISAATIRHWEKEKLLTPARNENNGYRVYCSSDVCAVILISVLQHMVYSLEEVRRLLLEVEKAKLLDQPEKIGMIISEPLDRRLLEQMKGAAAFYELVVDVG